MSCNISPLLFTDPEHAKEKSRIFKIFEFKKMLWFEMAEITGIFPGMGKGENDDLEWLLATGCVLMNSSDWWMKDWWAIPNQVSL